MDLYDVQSEMEKRITDAVNGKGIGPIGLGGASSVLATFIKIGDMRASGFGWFRCARTAVWRFVKAPPVNGRLYYNGNKGEE